jgi:Cell wall-active antibiotics response LiaF, C-terminal
MKATISGSNGMVPVIIIALLLGAVSGCASQGSTSGGNVLTHNLSEPLNGATTAKVDINVGDGNLTIDRLTGGEQLLAGGTLQYLEDQGQPTRTLVSFLDQAALTLKASSAGQPWFRLPWTACNGATEWLIHLNPTVSYDITAHSDGGNVKLNLADMAVTRVSADTGGGNMDVALPDNAANLSVTAKTGAGNLVVDIGRDITGNNTINANSGAGNVVVRIPSDIPARIHVTGGLGKAILVSRFGKIDDNTYQSPDYDDAANKVEITVNSGAGFVSVNTK